ncbi:MAG: hypothetical protein LIP11_10775 [Clostridiales bacterium]|nr:hypothetical protein [Clostridiales bacterium]
MTFDDITSKVRQISMDTVAEVQKMNEVRQLNSSINAEKKKIHSLYAEMGKKLYDKYRENPPEEFASEFSALKAEFESIEALRGQVRAKKGVTLCPNCKMEVGEFERFCSNCGCKMPEVFKIEEDEPTGVLETDESAAQASEGDDLTEEKATSEVGETEAFAEKEADDTETSAGEGADDTETPAGEEAGDTAAPAGEKTDETVTLSEPEAGKEEAETDTAPEEAQ